MSEQTISDLILGFFMDHPNQEFGHGPVVDWVTQQRLQTHSTAPRDPWRAIRKLHQDGKLIKMAKGIYKYDPSYIRDVEL